MREPMPPEFYHKFARYFGVALIIIGVIVGYFYIYTPIQQAKQHVAEIILWKKLIAISIICIIFGAALAIFNDRILIIFRNRDKPEYKKKYYMIMIPVTAVGIAAYFIISSYMDGLGYSEKNSTIENEHMAPSNEDKPN